MGRFSRFVKKVESAKRTLGLDEKSKMERAKREMIGIKREEKLLLAREKLEGQRLKLAESRARVSKLKSERFERAASAFLGREKVESIKKGDTFGTRKGFTIGIKDERPYNVGFGKKRR